MRKAINWLILVFIIYAFTELSFLFAGLIVIRLRPSISSPVRTASVSDNHREILEMLLATGGDYIIYDFDLGWEIGENASKSLYRANSMGIRADREYAPMPPAGVIRIASFGDSYTHGDEVENKDTWQERLIIADSGFEAMNFGVPGYGLDQAFLRYQEKGGQHNSHIVFIGFLPENIFRHVNVFRPFYATETGLPLTKPRFAIENDELTLIENPMRELSQYRELLARPEIVLPKIGLNDYFFQSPDYPKEGFFDFLPSVRLFKMWSYVRMKLSGDYGDIIVDNYYNTDSEAFRITCKLFDEFTMSVLQNDSLPILLLFLDRPHAVRYRNDSTKVYEPLLKHFEKMEYRYVDLARAFEISDGNHEIDDLYLLGHHSPLGNDVVAKYILEYLRENELTTSTAIRDELNRAKKRMQHIPPPAGNLSNRPETSDEFQTSTPPHSKAKRISQRQSGQISH